MIFRTTAMKKYIVMFAIVGCKKQAQPEMNNDALRYVVPTCAENLLFCDDDEFDDLPESGEESDTGE